MARGDEAVEELIRSITEAAESSDDPAEYRLRFLRSFGFPAEPTPLEGRALEAARASMTERQPWEAVIPLDELVALPVLLVQGDWCPAPLSARARAGAAFRAVCDVLHDRLDARRAVFPATHNAQRLGRVFNEQLRAFWEAV